MGSYQIWSYNGVGDFYDIGSYAYLQDATPNDSGITLDIIRAENNFYYRVNASGEYIFNKTDYTLLSGIIDSCEPFLLVYNDSCERGDFVTNNFWGLADYIGMIKKDGVTVDLDRCTIAINVETFDVYSRFLRTYDTVFNLINYKIASHTTTQMFEFEIETDIVISPHEVVEPVDPFVDGSFFQDGTGSFPYSILKVMEVQADLIENPTEWFVSREYVREVQYTTINVSPSGTWYGLGLVGGFYKWVRYPVDPTVVNGYDIEQVDALTITYSLPLRGEDDIINTRCIPVEYLLNKKLFDIDYGVFKSTFFKSMVNPITNLPNRLTGLLLLQQSDAKTRVDPARRQDTSVKAILDYLRLFNTGWHIEWDGTNMNLVIEHRKYYDNGGAYFTQFVDSDVNEVNRAVIKPNKDKLEKATNFVMGSAEYEGFIPQDIIYSEGCTNGELTNSISVTPLTTDYMYVCENQLDAPNDGIILIAGQPMKTQYYYLIYGAVVNNEGLTAINGDVAIYNIQTNYWIYGTPTDTGTVFGNAVNFSYTRRVKQRSRYTYNTRYNLFNPYRLLNTRIGIAEIESASYSVKNANFKLILLLSDT